MTTPPRELLAGAVAEQVEREQRGERAHLGFVELLEGRLRAEAGRLDELRGALRIAGNTLEERLVRLCQSPAERGALDGQALPRAYVAHPLGRGHQLGVQALPAGDVLAVAYGPGAGDAGEVPVRLIEGDRERQRERGGAGLESAVYPPQVAVELDRPARFPEGLVVVYHYRAGFELLHEVERAASQVREDGPLAGMCGEPVDELLVYLVDDGRVEGDVPAKQCAR